MANSPRVDIIFYTRQLHNGGVDRVVFNLAAEFLKRGLTPVILVDLENPFSPFRTLIPDGVGYEVLGAGGPISRFLKLRAYLRRVRPRAVMCTSFGFPNLFAVVTRWLAGVKFRLMLTEHCFPSVDKAAPRPWHARYWFFPLAHLLYPFADEIVAVSRGTALDLAKIIDIDPARISCIYNPIVSAELVDQSRQPIEHPWFDDGDTPVIIAVGRLEPQKDFATLIQAFVRVRQSRSCRLVILGDGSERQMLVELAERLGVAADVTLPGFAANPHAYTSRAALLVLSSRYESLANVVIEAMAVGTPVVATDCPSGPAEALDHGRYGTLVQVGDVDGMAKAILQALHERPAPVPAKWLDQFTTRNAADRYLELLKIPDARTALQC